MMPFIILHQEVHWLPLESLQFLVTEFDSKIVNIVNLGNLIL